MCRSGPRRISRSGTEMLLYTDLVREIVHDVARRVRDFRHLDPERIGVAAAARCNGQHWGNLATCYGLIRNQPPTFSIWARPGTRTIVAVSEWFQYRSPRVRLNGRDMTYLILLRLPRLLLRNPLPTLVHELYHISQAFDGDMRPDKHGAQFDREVRRLTQCWLERARGDLPRLAQMRLDDLKREFGAVLAQGVPSRFAFPLIEHVEPPQSYQLGVERLYPGCKLASNFVVRPAKLTPEQAPRVLTEKDLVLRLYDRSGIQRVPAAFTRYTRDYFQQIA